MQKSAVERRTELAVLHRRGFLEAPIFGLMSIVTGALTLTSAIYLFRAPKNRTRSAWVDAGDIGHLKPGVPEQVTFERTKVDGWKMTSAKESAWIVQSANETLTAFSPACTHLGCAYRWEPSRSEFVCPCHGSAFSITGRVLQGPAARPLERLQVKRAGSRVLLGVAEQV